MSLAIVACSQQNDDHDNDPRPSNARATISRSHTLTHPHQSAPRLSMFSYTRNPSSHPTPSPYLDPFLHVPLLIFSVEEIDRSALMTYPHPPPSHHSFVRWTMTLERLNTSLLFRYLFCFYYSFEFLLHVQLARFVRTRL